MRVRKLDENDDMSFGHGDRDYLINSPLAVAQSIKTRLSLWRGEWFLDTEEGMPWLTDILGKPKTPVEYIRMKILETSGVKEIKSFETYQDQKTRKVTVTVELSTIYGDVEVSV